MDEDVSVSATITEEDHERQEMQGFAVGDRILFRKNDADLGVMNGTFGTLKKANDRKFTVALDDGRDVTFSPKEYSHFQLGYAATVHKSQGVTVDEAYVLATPHFDRHTSYVALSRHKHNVKLYASKQDFKTPARLQNMLGRKGDKLSTLDFANTQQKQQLLNPRQAAPKAQSQKKKQPSFLQRIKQYFVREKAQPMPAPPPQHKPQQNWLEKPAPVQQTQLSPSRPLSQQEFTALRDEFIKKQQWKNSERNNQQQAHSHANAHRLER